MGGCIGCLQPVCVCVCVSVCVGVWGGVGGVGGLGAGVVWVFIACVRPRVCVVRVVCEGGRSGRRRLHGPGSPLHAIIITTIVTTIMIVIMPTMMVTIKMIMLLLLLLL